MKRCYGFRGSLVSDRIPNQKELRIAERVFAYNAGNKSKVACIDESD